MFRAILTSIWIGVGVVTFLAAGSANAVLMVTIDDDGTCNPVTGADCDTVLTDGDDNGTLSFEETLGNFSFIGAVAFTEPFIGSTTAPRLDYNYSIGYAATGDGSETLSVWISEIGFTEPTGTVELEVNIVLDEFIGTTDLFVWTGFVDSEKFGTDDCAGVTTTGGIATGECTGVTSPYALTGFFQTSFLDNVNGVDCPESNNCLVTGDASFKVTASEPAALALFAFGLAGLGFAVRRRRKLA